MQRIARWHAATIPIAILALTAAGVAVAVKTVVPPNVTASVTVGWLAVDEKCPHAFRSRHCPATSALPTMVLLPIASVMPVQRDVGVAVFTTADAPRP